MSHVDHHIPVHLAEAVRSELYGRRMFPFQSWAAANQFKYPWEAEDFLRHCGSAAEAFFHRPFTMRTGVKYDEQRIATADGLRLELQARAAGYYIDAIVSDGKSSLALEIDGLGFHHRKKEQVAADYVRQRRIVLVGHTVIRFTAQEAFAQADECWQQIEHILAKWRQR